jgi:plasmid stabilization system protein ParE
VTYRVIILPPARRQLLDQALWWSENRSAEQACYWLVGFEQALASLANNPERCAVAPESEAINVVLRELHYGLGRRATHRAVFEVRNDEVIIYSVRRLAQRDLMPHDLKPTKPE